MPIFRVEVNAVGFIVADSYEDAIRTSHRYVRDIVDDNVEMEGEVTGEVTSLSQLDAGWDGDCIPYGEGIKDRTLKEFLPPPSTT